MKLCIKKTETPPPPSYDMSVLYDYQVTDMDGRGVCGVAETPGMWDTMHTAFDRSSGTLGTVGGGGWSRFVA